jgi:hypothetical protein
MSCCCSEEQWLRSPAPLKNPWRNAFQDFIAGRTPASIWPHGGVVEASGSNLWRSRPPVPPASNPAAGPRGLRAGAAAGRMPGARREDGLREPRNQRASESTRRSSIAITTDHDYKHARGYSRSEIARKREALENRLIPFRPEENLSILREAGHAEPSRTRASSSSFGRQHRSVGYTTRQIGRWRLTSLGGLAAKFNELSRKCLESQGL